MYRLHDYHYTLPESAVAQRPVPGRDRSRLLILCRRTGRMLHRRFFHLPEWLLPGDVLVINNTEVFPARLFGKKETGGKVEVLVLDYPERPAGPDARRGVRCRCLLKAAKRLRPGARILFDATLTAEVLEGKGGVYWVEFVCTGDFEAALYRLGRIPLPPYIQRPSRLPTPQDAVSYQTVYARKRGAVAAPTAGLHFTPALFERLKEKGVQVAEITLHVGYGTFLPVRSADIRKHVMHAEGYRVSEAAAEAINAARDRGSRVVAVGTTCVRTLEFVSNDKGRLTPGSGACDLFIYPGYRFKAVDAMITNFHLPRSTLLMLVSAFAGREKVLAAYEEALRLGYRFYSFGDAMLIL